MTIHHHGTPITPVEALYELRGRHLCVSYSDPRDIARADEIAQSVMIDNGAYPKWKTGKPTNWPAYYAWVDKWLDRPTTWAVIPDVIDGAEDEQDRLIRQWPYGFKGAPVWHMNEPIRRLLALLEVWPRVCIGSTSIYAGVMSDPWQARIDEVFEAISGVFGRIPWLHMLRGMQCCGKRWPFASVDSTDIARNHNRPQNSARRMADDWDAVQCPRWWRMPVRQLELL